MLPLRFVKLDFCLLAKHGVLSQPTVCAVFTSRKVFSGLQSFGFACCMFSLKSKHSLKDKDLDGLRPESTSFERLHRFQSLNKSERKECQGFTRPIVWNRNLSQEPKWFGFCWEYYLFNCTFTCHTQKSTCLSIITSFLFSRGPVVVHTSSVIELSHH